MVTDPAPTPTNLPSDPPNSYFGGLSGAESRRTTSSALDEEVGPVAEVRVCGACGEPTGDGARFCEACGAPVAASAGPAAATATSPPATSPSPPTPATVGAGATPSVEAAPDPAASSAAPDPAASSAAPDPAASSAAPGAPAPPAEVASGSLPAPCPACGGDVAADGYCTRCGARAPVERDHREEQPAAHVAGVSDVGVRRRRNEDALALGVAGDVTVLVVCDGVSSAPDSDIASQAAATAARDVLVSGVTGIDAHDAGGWSRLLVDAGHRADAAAHASVDDATARQDPPSCTFAAAVVGESLLVAGWLGDSRVYWLPDDGPAEQLTEDDSIAAELMAGGMSRAAAERSPDAHAITRWLGADAGDTTARTVATRPGGPGWVLVCSDGLWNYASAPDVVAGLLRDALRRVGSDPLTLSRDLVDWARAAGGHDNVTVALTRLTPSSPTPPAPAADAHVDDAGTTPTVRRRPPGNLAEEPVPPAP